MGLETGVTNAKCDGAGCREYVAMREAKVGQIPEGWYRITMEAGGHRSEGLFIFHDLKCIERWAHERRRALGLTREVHRSAEAGDIDVRTPAPAGVSVNGSGRGVALAESKKQLARENRELVLMAFEDDPNLELTNSQVKAATGLSENGTRPHLQALVESGRLRIANYGTMNSKSDVRTYALVSQDK